MSKLLVGAFSLVLACAVSYGVANAAKGDKHGPMDPQKIIDKYGHDGVLTQDDFAKCPLAKRAKGDDAKVKEMFSKIDANGDGKISVDELKTYLDKAASHHKKNRTTAAAAPAAARTTSKLLALSLPDRPWAVH